MQELFRQARRSRLIIYDPAEGLLLPESVKRSHRPITKAERRHILAVAQNHPAGLWVLTILYTGLRPGETAALFWEDIDFDRNEIHVYKAVESGTRPQSPQDSRRDSGYPHAAGAARAPAGGPGRGYCACISLRQRQAYAVPTAFAGSGIPLLTLWTFTWAAKVRDGQILQHAIAPDLTPYCLRHTFCTDLQRAGVPINVAKELMGHANISVTANIYTHRDQKVLHNNMAKLNPKGRRTVGKAQEKTV